MRIPLIPRETKFFDMFAEDARNVLAAARLLEQFFRNYDDRERLASQHGRSCPLPVRYCRGGNCAGLTKVQHAGQAE